MCVALRQDSEVMASLSPRGETEMLGKEEEKKGGGIKERRTETLSGLSRGGCSHRGEE